MKVISISPMQSVYSNRNQQKEIIKHQQIVEQPRTFKGGKGATIGIFGGMITGALTAAAIVATGGLAAPLAAIGLSGVMGAGAACGTHVGGIVGHLIEESSSDDDKSKK